MSFDNIDVPVEESELFGGADAAPEASETALGDAELASDAGGEIPAESEPEAPAQEREAAIPRARFDEVNAKLHSERERAEAAERRLAELEQQSKAPQGEPTASSASLEEMESKFYDAMMDGDKEQATKIRAEINTELAARAERAASERLSRQLSEREVALSVASVGAKALADYPFLNHEADTANAEAIAEVIEWRDFYTSKGEPLPVALEKAVAKVAPSYVSAQPAAEAPAVDPRKRAALTRNAAESALQPPAPVAGIGNRAAPPRPKVDTQQDWEKLSDSDREMMLQ